jgi:hypothetical protein
LQTDRQTEPLMELAQHDHEALRNQRRTLNRWVCFNQDRPDDIAGASVVLLGEAFY